MVVPRRHHRLRAEPGARPRSPPTGPRVGSARSRASASRARAARTSRRRTRGGTASLDNTVRTGWLGRWLDAVGDPTDPLRAIALGVGLAGAGGGEGAVDRGARPDRVRPEHPGRGRCRRPQPGLPGDRRAAVVGPGHRRGPGCGAGHARRGRPSWRPALDRPADARTGPVEEGKLTTLLGVAGRVLDLGLGTQIIVVSVSGFDTHANEAAAHPSCSRTWRRGSTGSCRPSMRRVGPTTCW